MRALAKWWMRRDGREKLSFGQCETINDERSERFCAKSFRVIKKMFTQWRIIFAFNRKIHFHFATANCIDINRHLPGDAPELVISQSIASHSLSRRDMKGEGLHKLTASKAFIFSRDVSKLSKRTYREMKLATHKTARTWFWCNEIEALMCNFHRLAMPLICIQKDLDSERRGKINYAGS